MKNKIIAFNMILMIIVTLSFSAVSAVNEDVTLEKAEDNICEIELGDNGKLTKKLLSVDNTNKEVTLQIDVTNLKSEEEIIEPSEIMLVIDNSKSMTDNIVSNTTRKEAVLSAAKTLVHSILTEQSTTKIGVVSFSTNTDISKEGTLEDAQLQIALTSNENSIINSIDSIETTGTRTNIDSGLQVAKGNMPTNTSINQYIILLTDGVPNTAVGGPTITYSGEVTTKTKNTLESIESLGINIITVMTGVDSGTQPDPTGATSSEAAGKTYQNLAEEIFGTQSNPNYGKFYYVTDSAVSDTITKNVYSDVRKVKENIMKDIVVVDYFPDEIIENYNFEIIEKANIGIVTAEVNTENNSITWNIEKLKASETASFKYKLSLKENYNQEILNKIMPTNKKVDVSYVTPEGEKEVQISTVSPKIVLKGEIIVTEDNTVAPTEIPQTGEKPIGIIAIGAVLMLILARYVYNKNRDKK